MNGTHYENADELEITTLDNAVYMAMKNDVSFIFQFYLNLYEHQSTLNPNMPLRDLFYISRQLEKIVVEDTLYSSSLVKIPTPRFVIFYNGKDECPEQMELRLSDAFERKETMPALELKVMVLNINEGMNQEIIGACQTLREYCIYVGRVRKYTETMTIEAAVERAVKGCIAEGILSDFLKKQRAEVIAMSIFEYNEEEEIKKIRESERRSAFAEGENFILELIGLMAENGESSQISRLHSEPEFLSQMIRKYKLK